MLMIGCGSTERNTAPEAEIARDAGSASAATADPVVPASDLQTVLFIGTSLTAGLGLPEDQSFPLVIQEKIDEERLPFRVVNAGVSGETSAGAVRRIDWLVQQPFDVVVLETGANDMLRGTDPDFAAENIQTIIDRIREANPDAPIILAGMLSIPNLGPEYAREFEAIYPRLAAENDLELIPFLLEGVAGERALNQSDGVHPTAEGQEVVAQNVWEVLEPVLRRHAESADSSLRSEWQRPSEWQLSSAWANFSHPDPRPVPAFCRAHPLGPTDVVVPSSARDLHSCDTCPAGPFDVVRQSPAGGRG